MRPAVVLCPKNSVIIHKNSYLRPLVEVAQPLLMCPVVNGTTKIETETGGAKMISINVNKICLAGAVASAAAAVLFASGCNVAGAGAGLQRAAEVRVATTLEGSSPKLVVAGPARVLHVDVRGHRAVNVYSVKRGADGSVDCMVTDRSGVRSLQQSASNELNLVVRSDEGLCLANEAGDAAPRADVSWHARRGPDVPVEIAHADHAGQL